MAELSKASHYRSFYEMAKLIDDPIERCSYYDALDRYRFDGIEPEGLSPIVMMAFTGAKANIDADIERKKGGAKEGNTNAQKGKTCRKCAHRMSCDKEQDAEVCNKYEPSACQNNIDTLPKQPKTTQNNDKTNNVNVNDNVNVNENENENVNVNVNEVVLSSSVTPQQENYSKQVFDIFKNAGLPCSNKNQITFLMTDFKNALSYIHKSDELHNFNSSDIVQACKNYVEVLNDPASWVTGKMNFCALVKSKLFYNLLPQNYVLDNYRRSDADKLNPKINPQPVVRIFYEDKPCPECNEQKLHWMNERQRFVCTACNSSFKYEEVYQ